MSWPITLGKRTYEVCRDCGAEFDYSWERMALKHPGTPATAPPQVACARIPRSPHA
jgi:hypothetical protein